MRRVIKGLLYDTNASKLLGSYREDLLCEDGDGLIYRMREVYKTQRGDFFRLDILSERETSIYGYSESIERWMAVLLEEEAKAITMRYFPVSVYEENFEISASVK